MIEQKSKIWKILTKYDNTLIDFCDSLSNVIQDKSKKSDFIKIVNHYQEIDYKDCNILDEILGDYIMLAIND
jgi:ribosomal protein S18